MSKPDRKPAASRANRAKAESAAADADRVRFARILEATTDFVGMASPDGRLTYINQAGQSMLGYLPEDPLPLNLRDLHPEWACEIVMKEGLPSATRDGYWKGETALLRRDGHEIPVSQVMLSHPGPDGSVEFVSTIIRDISDRKREEIARIEWANRYDAAIRSSGQLLFDWNSFTNDITYAGDIERFLGYTMSEMQGGLDRFRQIVHPADLQRFDDEIQRVTSTRDPFRLDYRVWRKDQREITVSANGYFFLDRLGHFGRMVGFLADITSQRAAQEELARGHENLETRVAERTAELARAYAELKDRALQQEMVSVLGQRALSGVDLHMLLPETAKVVRATLRVDYCSILELSPDGAELQCMAQAGWPDPSMTRVAAGKDSQSGYTLMARCPVIMEDSHSETRFNVSDEAKRSSARSGVTVAIESGSDPIGILAAFALQPRKFTQDDVFFLQSVANVLTAAIERKRAEDSIRTAIEQAEGANRAKTEFLSRMSHELRTPLNAILGFTQLLEIDNPSPSQAESIEHISKAGRNLLSLINEVLDISRLESGHIQLQPEPIEVAPFLREAIEFVQDLAARHAVQLRVDSAGDSTLHVLADRKRLSQVFTNLLSNAVKFNRPGGTATVNFTARPDRTVRIGIADTGIGIAPEKMARLFLPFERCGAESTNIEGSGIGLALSRSIVRALQGEITVESVEGKGSTFWVALPCPETEPESPAEPPPARSSQQTVLYIEDQELNVRLVERVLAMRPEYHLLTALRGGIGIELARKHLPDLILLDLNLPDMAGEDILRILKTDPALTRIPVIMLSANAFGERVEAVLAQGASGYLTKPYKVADLLRIIATTIDRVGSP
jgi:PAS domain S-box-containing protein